METIRNLMLTADSIMPGILGGILISVLVNAFRHQINNGFKIIVLPLYILFFLFVIYKIVNTIPLSKNAIYEEVNYNNAYKKWKLEKPNEEMLYSQLRYLHNDDRCLVCGDRATYGTVYQSRYASSENIRPDKVDVCSKHKELLDIYICDNCSMSDYFKSNYQNTYDFMSQSLVQSIDKKSMDIILRASFIEGKIEIEKLVDNVSKSKEEILSKAGTYLWMLIFFTVVVIFMDKKPEKD